MDKVKVSRDIADALDLGIKICGKEKLLNDHAKCKVWILYVCFPLNKLSTLELAEILVKGYEIEETPEEKILNMYNFNNDFSCAFDRGYQLATRHVLETLNIKIKGIND